LTHATTTPQTVFARFSDTVARHAARPFLQVLPETAACYRIAAQTLSYGEALHEVERLAAIYRAAGYRHGHRAGLMLENRPAFFLHWLALNALGVSVVPINTDMRAAELNYLIGHSEICLAVVLPERAADLRAAAAQAGRSLVIVGPELAEAVAPAPCPAPIPYSAPLSGEPGTDTECALLYTSGTTGRPKGCVLTNDYFLLAGAWYNGIGGLCTLAPGEERLITPLPMVHMNAMAYSTMAMIFAGGCIIPLDRFHPRSWWASVRESRATVMHYLGVMPAMLMGAPATAQDREHRVRFGFGAGVDKLHHASFEQRFGVPLIEAWAMSETGAGAVIIANHEPRHIGTACFGKPEAALEVRLVDDNGQDAGTGHPGELWVRASGFDPRRGFFREYLKDPQASFDAWDGGWFRTGDIVVRDSGGYLHFVDRKKNVIRRSGENIAAVEVESVLRQHPAVQSVAVAAAPDPVRGDEVLALVVLHDQGADPAATAVAITEYCLTQLAYYKAPGYVAFVDQLPLTTSQKIQRGTIREWAQQLPGTACCIDTRALKKRHA
jgi:acyl-CoA synthetase (AMP-forming)/AMP-acid ligase II